MGVGKYVVFQNKEIKTNAGSRERIYGAAAGLSGGAANKGISRAAASRRKGMKSEWRRGARVCSGQTVRWGRKEVDKGIIALG